MPPPTRKPHLPYSLYMRLVGDQFREMPALVCLLGNTTVLYRPEPRHGQRECTFSLTCSTKFRLNDQANLTSPGDESSEKSSRCLRCEAKTSKKTFAGSVKLSACTSCLLDRAFCRLKWKHNHLGPIAHRIHSCDSFKVAFQTCLDRLVRLRKLERATGDLLVKVDVAS